MPREKCDRCGSDIRAMDVTQSDVGVYPDLIDGGPPKLKIDLVVACPDCGFSYYYFVDIDELMPMEGE